MKTNWILICNIIIIIIHTVQVWLFSFSDFLILSKLIIIIIIGKILIIFVYSESKTTNFKEFKVGQKKTFDDPQSKKLISSQFPFVLPGRIFVFVVWFVKCYPKWNPGKIFQVPYWTLNFFQIGTYYYNWLFCFYCCFNFLIVYRYLWEKNHHL